MSFFRNQIASDSFASILERIGFSYYVFVYEQDADINTGRISPRYGTEPECSVLRWRDFQRSFYHRTGGLVGDLHGEFLAVAVKPGYPFDRCDTDGAGSPPTSCYCRLAGDNRCNIYSLCAVYRVQLLFCFPGFPPEQKALACRGFDLRAGNIWSKYVRYDFHLPLVL